jgi:hypothetical protein
MSVLLEYKKITDARANLKEIYDSASAHVSAVVQRDTDAAVAVVNREDLLEALRALCPVEPQVRFGDGYVAMWVDGLPVSAQEEDFDSVAVAFIQSLREFADLWAEDLRHYPNHRANWGIANLVLLSSDAALHSHIFGED